MSNIPISPMQNGALPNPEELFKWPFQAMREQNWEEAIHRWSIFRRAFPESAVPWFQEVQAHIHLVNLTAAKELLRDACPKFPNHPSSILLPAQICILEGKQEDALALLRKAIKTHPNVVQTWTISSQLAEKMGDFAKALEYNETARQCAPELPLAFIQHAELAERQEQWNVAIQRWTELQRKFPNLSIGFTRGAEAARKLGDKQKARNILLTQEYGEQINDFQFTGPRAQKTAFSIRKFIEIIWTKSFFNLRSEVNRNYLSYGWWILEPLLHMAVYYVVFGKLLGNHSDNFPQFLLTGLVPWMWFMKAVSSSSNSILSGKNLMLQVGLPSIVFPMVSIVQTTVKQIPTFLLLFGFVALTSHEPTLSWWALLPIIGVQVLIITSFGLLVAAIIPFARDLSYLVPTGLTLMMFLSGIFYDYRTISAEWRDIFLLNPMAFILKSYRECLLDDTLPDFTTLFWLGLFGLVSSLLLIALFQKLRYIYPRLVIE